MDWVTTNRVTSGLGLGVLLATTACYEPLPTPMADGSAGSTGEDTANEGTSGEPGGESTGDAAAVTYHETIRPLVEQHCMGCHQPGNIGPFDLTSYDEVFVLREAIALSVMERTMPPWQPGPGCADYVADSSLSEEQIELFSAWVDGGAPEGNPDDYVPPTIPEPPGMSRIDLTLTLPEPYQPQKQPDDYRCFLLDWPYDETTYISGFAARPDQTQTVHHIIAFGIDADLVDTYEALDEAEPGVGYTCFGGPGGSVSTIGETGKWLGSWAPGGNAGDFPEGTGIRMDPGSKVVLQVHYNTLVDEVLPDQSGVDFKIDTEVEHPAGVLLWANPNWLSGGMHIPAGAESTVHIFEDDPSQFLLFLTDAIPPGEPFRIHQTGHHMHTLGTAAQQSIVRADGSETCLLEIPRWDFNWQSGYRFTEPVVFNPGDKLRMACQWDNSAGESSVNWGDGTQDEMCLGVLYATGL